MKAISFFILIIIAVAIAVFIAFYNKLIHMIEAVLNNQKQIDIQLDRRYKNIWITKKPL